VRAATAQPADVIDPQPRQQVPDDTCWNCDAPRSTVVASTCPGCGISYGDGSLATEATDMTPFVASATIEQAAAADSSPDGERRRLPWEPAPDAGPPLPEVSQEQRELPEPATSEAAPIPETSTEPAADASPRLFNSPLVTRAQLRRSEGAPAGESESRPHRIVDNGMRPAAGGVPWATPPGPSMPATSGSRGRPPPGPPPPGPTPPMAQQSGPPGPSSASGVAAAVPSQPSATPSTGSMAGPRTHVAPSVAATMSVGNSASVVGIITGPVSQDTRYYRFWGWKVLSPLLVVAALSLLAVAAVSGQVSILGSGLFTAVVVLVFLLIIMVMAVGVSFSDIAHAIGRAGAGAARQTVKAGGRGLAAGTKGAVSVATRGSISEQSLPVRRFRVQSPLGRTYACVMIGELQGDELRQGDLVRVYGRERRDGHRNTRKVEILQSVGGAVSSIVLARRPASFSVPWLFDWVAKLSSLVIVSLMLFLLYRALR
jgi:hypothetical protein